MNFFIKFFVFCLLIASSLFAEAVVKYQIVDIGVLSFDASSAIAINDRGQVLGRLKNQGKWEFFLWDKEHSLQIINLPEGSRIALNNKGQIAGTSSEGKFIWDSMTGLYHIGRFDGAIVSFNDNGEILFSSNDENSRTKIYLWSSGVLLDISKEFSEQCIGYDLMPNMININNKGQVTLTARCLVSEALSDNSPLLWNSSSSSSSSSHSSKDYKKYVFRSFIWFNGEFEKIFSEYDTYDQVQVLRLDENDNVCIILDDMPYFMNKNSGIQAKVDFHQWGHLIIRNGIPQISFCLPSKIRKNLDGSFYYLPGIEIRKLIEPCYPYWIDKESFKIYGQNSNGQVVGVMETLCWEQKHAFLAVPVTVQ